MNSSVSPCEQPPATHLGARSSNKQRTTSNKRLLASRADAVREMAVNDLCQDSKGPRYEYWSCLANDWRVWSCLQCPECPS